MRALILTDSHSHFNLMFSIFKSENPDIVIFAGDNSKDGIELSYINSDIKFYIVKGNCDFFDHQTDEILEFNLEGKRVLLTHGHLYGVKRNYSIIENEAIMKEMDIVIFGHTHIPYYEKKKNIHFFNPGATQDGNYGILEIKNGEVSFEHKRY